MRLKTVVLVLLPLIICTNAWKKCKETFCNQVRQSPTGYKDRYSLDLESVKIEAKTMEAELLQLSSKKLKFMLSIFEDYTVRIHIDEIKSKTPRYRAAEALYEEHSYKMLGIKVLEKDEKSVKVGFNTIEVVINANNLMTEVYVDNKKIAIINSPDRFVFETEEEKSAIAMGITFPETQHAYGLPEHADRLTLRNTNQNNLDPYRHFNVDYGGYLINSTQSIYGAIGVLYAHGTTRSSGVFWLNSAQTWIDVSSNNNEVDAFFMSESGVLEMYILAGPTLADTVKQYSKLTGTASLPPYFSLGYHQSRYSYMTQQDVLEVITEFDKNGFPVDVIWLDIDYTDGKKYFTWNSINYSDPDYLLKTLSETNRKLVAIIDPHIKVDVDYFLHATAASKDYYIKNPDGSDYQGDCWPGLSSYLDFLNPEALNYYSNLYKDHHFQAKNMHIWNDMNEPAVFEDSAGLETPPHEKTVPSNSIHFGNVKHRDVHNIYGFYQVLGTYKGFLSRQLNLRPFILTRSHFAGIQRYAAIWTGDNAATWDYLQVSIPMCLTEALAGVSFCGADVGGFFDHPEDELYQRWYQAGIWLPFFRGHSTINVPRREPYLYSKEIQNRVRTSMRLRYAHLPVWYTLFREHEITGEPVIRPITYHYSSDTTAQSIDYQILIGSSILAAPVLNRQASSIDVYLPGGETEIWYNIDENYKKYTGTGFHTLGVTIDSSPAFYKGGTIITRKEIPRPVSADTVKDSYTVYICLNINQNAEGTLYIDDFESFKYTNKEYIYIRFSFKEHIFSSSKIDTNANYNSLADINEVIIINPPADINNVTFIEGHQSDQSQVTLIYNDDKTILTIKDLSLKPEIPFKIQLRSSSDKLGVTLIILTVICFIFN